MNLVILDGRINSAIEKVEDRRRRLARFIMATSGGDRIGIEVRGSGADRLYTDWNVGDNIHVRGHLKAGGVVSADIIRRLDRRDDGGDEGEQLSLSLIPLMSRTAMHFAGHAAA